MNEIIFSSKSSESSTEHGTGGIVPQYRDAGDCQFSGCPSPPIHLVNRILRTARQSLLAACVFIPLGSAVADSTTSSRPNPDELSLQQLINIKITSVSKKETRLEKSPAAVTVITQDDIRRLGIQNIPDALRLVPGMDVAQIDSHTWAISSRGFNIQYANGMQVLVDGRSIYTPSFGGVLWDAQDLPMEDIDRIEVIRGPGATLWGANAVNGVVNIITKRAKDTQGLLVSQSLDNELRTATTVRYGGTLATNLYYRAYVKYFNRDGFVTPGGSDAPGDWNSLRGGLRMDWQPSNENLFTLQGDAYSLDTHEEATLPLLRPPYIENEVVDEAGHGENALGRWTRTFSEDSQLSVQAYFDSFRHGTGTTIESRDTADIQLQDRFPLGGHNDVTWGLEYRFTTDDMRPSPVLVWIPESQDLNLYTTFLQDEITLVPDRLKLTIGSKFDHNDYTGFEIQPNGRLAWTPTRRQTVWASVSRAVNTPPRFYRGTILYGPAGFEMVGNPDAVSEVQNSFELGYRIAPIQTLSFDVAAFYNLYDHLENLVPGASPLEMDWQNNTSAQTYGGEISAQWEPINRWRLVASYSLLKTHFSPTDTFSESSPQQQVGLRSYLDLPQNLQLNCAASYVGRIRSWGYSGETVPVPSYVRLDVGLVWHPAKWLEIGVWGDNLLDGRHLESASQNTTFITEVPRSIMGKITFRF